MSDPRDHRPITFLSDFGLDDEFVGVVHGVVATLAPPCRVIDLNHQIDPGNIRAGALALMRAIQYMPPGVVLAVVDPGVGTERRAVALETPWGHLVGPDNGLLSPAAALVGGVTAAHSIENPDIMLPARGATFAGRDRLAPAAALLASGQARLDQLGPAIDVYALQPLLLPLAEVSAHSVTGEAWWVDRYGNIQTNISPEDLAQAHMSPAGMVSVQVGATPHLVPWVETYGNVADGQPLLHVDSSGLMALAVRSGRADKHFQLRAGTAVVFAPAPPQDPPRPVIPVKTQNQRVDKS